ncbi:MAG: GTP-binding protein [Phycisphaerales bacterium]|nr:GTP-binding protein [Phycisphaerales bacterium]
MAHDIIDLADVPEVLRQAAVEQWTHLALVGPGMSDERIESYVWPSSAHVLRVRNAIQQFDVSLLRRTSLSWIDLQANEIGVEGARSIAEGLPRLTWLGLNYNRVSDAAAIELATGLENLEVLNLSSNPIHDNGIRAISKALSKLTSLDLSWTAIGEIGVAAITSELKNLATLNLSRSYAPNVGAIGNTGARLIAKNLKKLKVLDLGNQDIDDDGARALAKGLAGLTSLDLSFGFDEERSRIGDRGAQAIASRLRHLTALGLSYNDIGPAGAREIATNLNGLTRLSLTLCKIGDEGAHFLSRGLRNLSHLELAVSNVADLGACEIAANLEHLTYLDLSGNEIGDPGVRAIAQRLRNLTSLLLSGNNVTEYGARMIADGLKKLAELRIGRNPVGNAGAKAIAIGLNDLKTLEIADSGIDATGVQAIAGRLGKLTWLDLNNNPSVGDSGALMVVNKLTRLRGLCLRRCGIGDSGAKGILTNLKDLKFLDLSSNQLTSLPRETSDLTQLSYFNVRANPSLELPPELRDSANGAAIRDHVRRLYLEERRPLCEAKLLLVGQGGVGKTSLVRQLVDGTFDPDERKTEGIGRTPWQVEGRTVEEQVNVNIWDFGGQEVMHATHQFFLTRRSVYLVVVDARKGENEGNIHYWLKIVETFGGESPVIVVVNKCDGPNNWNLNETGLKREYPNIRGFVKTSCESGAGIDNLKVQIAELVHELPHVFEEWPESYFNLKRSLAERAREQNFLPEATFRSTCAENNVTDTGEQNRVLRLFHDLGTILNYGETPNDRYRLNDTNVLDPEWVTGGVYRILNHHEYFQDHGIVRLDELPKVLTAADGYPIERHGFIIGMMDRFDLCFEMQHDGKQAILVPELLLRDEPLLEWNKPGSLRFEYHYEILPSGLIPRFIVLSKSLRLNPPVHWRSGVALEAEGCRVLVRGDEQKARVVIAVQPLDGVGTARRRALAMVRAFFSQIHETIPAEEMVPLPMDPDADPVKYTYLCELERDEGPEYTWRPQGASRKYSVRELLEGIEEPGSRNMRRLMDVAQRVEEQIIAVSNSANAQPSAEVRAPVVASAILKADESWWQPLVVPGVAAALAVAMVLTVICWPTSPLTPALAVGMVVFGVVWFLRQRWRWRSENWDLYVMFTCLPIVGVAGTISFGEASWVGTDGNTLKLSTGSTPIAIIAGGLIVVFGIIRLIRELKKTKGGE